MTGGYGRQRMEIALGQVQRAVGTRLADQLQAM
jgi:hypothetical protein